MVDARPPLAVIGAATSAAAYGPGQEKAPDVLRRHGLIDALVAEGRPVRDAGDVVSFVQRPDPEHPQAGNAAQAAQAVHAVAAAVADAFARGEHVLVLGGDCTVELGTVAGALSDGSSVGLVYIDGDGDLNTPDTGTASWTGWGWHTCSPSTAVCRRSSMPDREPRCCHRTRWCWSPWRT